MNDNLLDTQHRHGKEMHILGLKHSLEMARIFRDYQGSLDDLIKHLEEKLVKESQPEHSRFDLEHIKTCDECRDAHDDFIREQEDDNRE